MRKKNRPVYRRGREQCRRIQICLNLLEQYHGGCLRDPRQRLLAKMMEEELTGKQLDYLRCYYANAMTHGQIARMLGRDASTVTRGITRAEEKLEQIMKRGAALWGTDFPE